MSATRLATVADVEAMADEPGRVALIEGELFRMVPEGGRHGRLAVRFTVAIDAYVEAQRLGVLYGADTGSVLQRSPDTLLAPDLAFIQDGRAPEGEEEIGYPDVVPDFVVEILSPSNTSSMMAKKLKAYLATGVRLIWAIDPVHSTVVVHQGGGSPRVVGHDDVLDGGDVLPGLRLPIADIFRD
jgi:Uma2 family endonuclease